MAKNPNGFEFYQDSNKKHRWRKRVNGNIVSASTQGYASKWYCTQNAIKEAGYKP